MASSKKNSIDSRPRLAPAIPYILTIIGIIGLICSFILSNESTRIPTSLRFVSACTLNPIFSCTNVLHASQGSVFGFPNAWIDIAVFTVFITVGISIFAGAQFKRWFWLTLAVGTMLVVIFVYWMLFESVYRINALCLLCLIINLILTITFWYLILYIIREQHLPIPRRLIGIADFARRYHGEILISWLLIIVGLILHHFWYYYSKFI